MLQDRSCLKRRGTEQGTSLRISDWAPFHTPVGLTFSFFACQKQVIWGLLLTYVSSFCVLDINPHQIQIQQILLPFCVVSFYFIDHFLHDTDILFSSRQVHLLSFALKHHIFNNHHQNIWAIFPLCCFLVIVGIQVLHEDVNLFQVHFTCQRRVFLDCRGTRPHSDSYSLLFSCLGQNSYRCICSWHFLQNINHLPNKDVESHY